MDEEQHKKKYPIRGASPKRKPSTTVNENEIAYFSGGPIRAWAYQNPNDEAEKFHGCDLAYLAFRVGRRDISIHLTDLTLDELEWFQRFMNHAIDEARPLVQQVDQASLDAAEEGNSVDERLYRPVPTFLTRERGIPRYHSGVPGRLAGLLGSMADDQSQPNGSGGTSESVGVSEPDDLGTTDNSGEDGGAP